MEKIKQVNLKIRKNKGVPDSLSYLGFDTEFFDKETNQMRLKLRKFLNDEVQDLMVEYVEKAQFPERAVEKLKQFDLVKDYMSKPYGNGQNMRKLIAIIIELGRCDASLATFYLVQTILCGNTIDDFGSDEQKQYILPKIRTYDMIGGWGLTEQNIGSDASNMETKCEKLDDGRWKINGNKRWIGNANKDIMVVFAKDIQTKNVQGFIVFLNNNPNVKRTPIKNKLSLRSVQNMQLYFNDLIVDEKWRLPKVESFRSVAKMLAHSRLFVCWVAVSMGIGIYDHVFNYIEKRRQFNKNIMEFQLVQQKLVRIMGNVQASLSLAQKLTELTEQKKISIGKLGLGKAWITKRIREAAALGREMLGGNGIVSDNHVMRAFCDIEAIFTYEGSYDINSLVAGRELTGYSAFK